MAPARREFWANRERRDRAGPKPLKLGGLGFGPPREERQACRPVPGGGPLLAFGPQHLCRDKPIAPRLTMAERFRRAPDWVYPSRMPGPDHCLQRGASAPDSALLRELLQQSSDAPVTQQRRAGASSNSAPWRPKVTSCSRWTTSPIRPNLVFGTDRVKALVDFEISSRRWKQQFHGLIARREDVRRSRAQ